jgi:hypothetical protein
MGVTYTTSSAATYVPIATTTVGTATSDVTFSSLPTIYIDIVAVVNFTLDTTGGVCWGYVNGIFSGTPYSTTLMTGDGSFALSTRYANVNTINFTQTPINTNLTTLIVQYMNYNNATTYKSILARQNTSTNIVNATASLWRSTSAITSISFNTFNTQKFVSGSTFTLYGILGA